MEVIVDNIEGVSEVRDEPKMDEEMLMDPGDLSLSVDNSVSIILLN